MNKKLIVLVLLSLVLLTGCINIDKKTSEAYFDLNCDSCSGYERQNACDDICDNSGIRISRYKNENKVLYFDGDFVCRCY